MVRNYENAIRAVGGTIRQSVPTWWVNGTIVKDGRETWVQAEKGNGKIWLRIVEKQAIGEIAAMLKSDPGVNVFIVGHTDNTGTVDGNLTLSRARAGGVPARAPSRLRDSPPGRARRPLSLGTRVRL